VWEYCIIMQKYILVDFSKILKDLKKTYKNQSMLEGYNFGPLFSRCINDNDDGDEILIVTKGVIKNTVLGKFVLIRKRNGFDTKMIIDKIDDESGLKNFCVNRIFNSNQIKRGFIIDKNFVDLIYNLKPHIGQITEYLIYVKKKPAFLLTKELDNLFVKKKPAFLLTKGLDDLFQNIKTRLLGFYKDELVDTMIKSYVGNTIDYIEPSVPLVFPDLKEGQTFSKKTRYRHETEVISKITQYDGYKEYKVKEYKVKEEEKEEEKEYKVKEEEIFYTKCLYDFLDEYGQNLIDLNNNATPGRKTFKDMFKSIFTKKNNEDLNPEDITLTLEDKTLTLEDKTPTLKDKTPGGKPRRTRRHKNKKRRSSKQQKSKK